ncbi:MAG: acyl-CoA thioesterase [Bacteroidetes bacterium]|nr:acyl-CoA thioesterase [Bacteroidota bacterium]
MADFPKLLESTATIRFQDCDPFNHLNNTNYIPYFLNAREDQVLDAYDLDIYGIALKKGLTWLVITTKIAYFNPAMLMEEVIIESQLINYSEKDITVEMRMFNEEKSHLKAFIWMTFIHFNLKKNSVENHSKEYLDLFEKAVFPVEQKMFDERHAALGQVKNMAEKAK